MAAVEIEYWNGFHLNGSVKINQIYFEVAIRKYKKMLRDRGEAFSWEELCRRSQGIDPRVLRGARKGQRAINGHQALAMARELGASPTSMFRLDDRALSDYQRLVSAPRLQRQYDQYLAEMAAWPVPLEPVGEGSSVLRFLQQAQQFRVTYTTEALSLDVAPAIDALIRIARQAAQMITDSPASAHAMLLDAVRDIEGRGLHVHWGRYSARVRVTYGEDEPEVTFERIHLRCVLLLHVSHKQSEADYRLDRLQGYDDLPRAAWEPLYEDDEDTAPFAAWESCGRLAGEDLA